MLTGTQTEHKEGNHFCRVTVHTRKSREVEVIAELGQVSAQ